MKRHTPFLRRLGAVLVGSAVLLGTATAPVMPVTAAEVTIDDPENPYDFARALQYSMYFYDANMCGDQVEENTRLSWRGDCHAYDAHVPMKPWDGTRESGGTNLSQAFMDQYKDILDPDGDGTIDVAGGFHDAGDHVEFGMPENYTAATLGWGYFEFRDAYKKLGQDDHIETLLRYVNDYLMKCTFRDKDGTVIAHCYQVGEGGIDHDYWESPEVDEMVRPAWFLTAEKPQTDYVVSACASLAINYLNFKDTDPDYAAKSLDYAKALWKFANDNPKELSDNADGPRQFYGSNKWEDDYCWAAAWMYEATGDASVFEQGAYEIFDYYAPSGWCYCWNDMWSGAALRWAVINQEHPELDMVQKIRDAQGKNEYVFDNFWDKDCLGKCFPTWKDLETPGGYAFLNQWGSARYNTAMQLICLLYDKYTNDGKPGEYSQWAKSQMEYIMGNNPLSRSYIVGYNKSSVKYPHHRAASGLLTAEDTREQRHVLWGALAGGPDGSDKHNDTTNDYIYNEVTIDYNAAFVGACAGLYTFFGTDDMHTVADFPPAEAEGSGDSEGGSGYWVEACGIDDLKSDGSGVTKISFKVMTGSNKPSDKISVRYYFNASEIGNIGLVKASKLYDQAATEAQAVSTITETPVQYDKAANTYYIEIAWDGYKIANSGKKYQFTVGLYYGDKWDPSNDWSYDGLTIFQKDTAFFGNGNEARVENICVYDDGVLVGGTEPDGSTPVIETKPAETTTKPATTTTTTKAVTTTAEPKETTTTTTTAKVTESATQPAQTTTTEIVTESAAQPAQTTTKFTATTTAAVATGAGQGTTERNEGDNHPTKVLPDNALLGDVNLDQLIDITDAVLLNKAAADVVVLNDMQRINGDCNVDDEIGGADAQLLLRFIVGSVKALG